MALVDQLKVIREKAGTIRQVAEDFQFPQTKWIVNKRVPERKGLIGILSRIAKHWGLIPAFYVMFKVYLYS